MNRSVRLMGLLALPLVAASCIHMTHEIQQSKPLEINVNVKIQRELDDFYSFQDKYDPTTRAAAATTAPATAPAQ